MGGGKETSDGDRESMVKTEKKGGVCVTCHTKPSFKKDELV